ncbi:hypothetical protein XELAEV_18004335mg [Xenopus laevis]|uniref:Uncharacterized protein n=1 Tax=Xenopus laevis TaxID=8355 RepID=A0A974BQ03_XENLA|nr:hypothetical protein XELAEV_18004335mg [Xenopus laevis]
MRAKFWMPASERDRALISSDSEELANGGGKGSDGLQATHTESVEAELNLALHFVQARKTICVCERV